MKPTLPLFLCAALAGCITPQQRQGSAEIARLNQENVERRSHIAELEASINAGKAKAEADYKANALKLGGLKSRLAAAKTKEEYLPVHSELMQTYKAMADEMEIMFGRKGDSDKEIQSLRDALEVKKAEWGQ